MKNAAAAATDFSFSIGCCQNDLYGFLHALKHVFFKALLLYDQNSHKSLTMYVLLLAGTTIFFLVAAAGCVDLWQSEYPKPIFFFKLFCQIFVIIEDFSMLVWTEGTQELLIKDIHFPSTNFLNYYCEYNPKIRFQVSVPSLMLTAAGSFRVKAINELVKLGMYTAHIYCREHSILQFARKVKLMECSKGIMLFL